MTVDGRAAAGRPPVPTVTVRSFAGDVESTTVTDVLIPGGRDVRGTLDAPDPDGGTADSVEAVVVACPPHPQHGGSRSDPRLVAVSDALRETGIACLRFDYGAWDEGYGERADAENAIRWAGDRYDRVGVFGYSFGASLALLAAGEVGGTKGGSTGAADVSIAGVSALAPTARLAADLDCVSALDGIDAPVQVLYGERDSTVDWEPVVERARERGDRVVALPADHFFLGTRDEIARECREFFERVLLEP